jgi:hypothetical protein
MARAARLFPGINARLQCSHGLIRIDIVGVGVENAVTEVAANRHHNLELRHYATYAGVGWFGY